MASLEDYRLPSSILTGLYTPTYLPEDLNLNEFITDTDAVSQTVQRGLARKIENATLPEPNLGLDGIPVPLTEAEAQHVDAYMENLQERINKTKNRIASVRNFIDETAAPANGEELSFNIDISKRPVLKKAISKVFGFKSNTITYSMYKAALERKRQLEKDESDNYVSGKFKQEDKNFGVSATDQENHV